MGWAKEGEKWSRRLPGAPPAGSWHLPVASLRAQSCRSLRKHQEEGEAGQVKGLPPGSQPQG